MEITCKLDASIPDIIADGDQITQVIINLVINAEQAINKSGVGNRIEVSTRPSATGNAVEIRVKDNGPGIPDSIRGRIFEPFFTTKDVGDGTGIGLAFCHRIVLSHGGHIWLDQNYRGGSRFCIRLPVTSSPNSGTRQESVEQAERNLRILVLDDEAEVAELISIMLQKEGFSVDIANKGEVAFDMLRNATYDIVLSDLNMPGMDGRAIFETIRKNFPHMLDRLGFITGDTMGAASQSLLEESGRPHLEKPVSPADLRQLIGRLLGENGGKQ
jgi:CheY-like chemotaxis protein